MRKFGLIGYPLGHSFSKTYFTEKFLKEGIEECSYENFPLPNLESLPELLLEETDLLGLNVTIPYKSEVLKYIDVIDDEAREVGAVNVLKIKRVKSRIMLYGFNSDITGIFDSLIPFILEKDKNAVVLGTGGSSRAVCHVLRKLGLKVTPVSRNKSPGFLCYSDLDADTLSSASIVVNTTPLGMFPDTETKPDINYSLLNEKHILFDLVYNPEFTLFLRKGIEKGCRIITGVNMLHSQAERAWQIWNDESL